LIFEALIYGAIVLWLLAVIPAAVITVLKGRWSYFFCGWLTFGIVWIIGATALAPADSSWAKWFYDEEKLARAQDPVRHPRSKRSAAYAAAGVLALVLVVGLFAARPTPILGVEGSSLERSVGGGIGGIPAFELGPCRHLAGNRWMCSHWDDQVSGQVSYLVRVDNLGCWQATRVGPPGEGSPKYRSDCVTVFDYLFS
jgi:hypothetical protein